MAISLSRWSGRRLLATALVSAWGFGVAALLMALGGECPVAGEPLATGEARGWTLRYVLSQDTASEILAHRLIARGHLSNLGTEIELHGAANWTQQLANAGWKISETVNNGALPEPPRLEILDSRRSVVWTGIVPADELRVPSAALFDQLLVARLARGQSTPRIVPIGCAPQA